MTGRDTQHDQGFSTRAIHAGEAPDADTGASAPNLVMSTTFAAEEPLDFSFSDFDGANDAPYIYTRWGNPTVTQLEDKLANLEEAAGCLAFASGMAASSSVLLGMLSPGDHLVVSNVNYAGTAELVRHTLPRMNIAVTPVDTSSTEQIAAAVGPETRMVWIETPANPILRLTDIAAAAQVAHASNAVLVVDSTFATPVATRPVTLGADLVVHSLTKYIGGHGDALGGAVAGRADLIERLRAEAVIHYGGVISPFNAWLIMRGMATLPIRMRAHADNALTVARFLENHPAVARVLYPGLESHPQHELARQQMANYSGMVSFQVASPNGAADRVASKVSLIHYAVSLGHHRSLIYWIDTGAIVGSSFGLVGQALADYRDSAGDGVFRLSVGLEDAEDLCRDLDAALS